MRIAVTGSIATDHLMHFPGRFTDSFVSGKLDKVSLSFLVDELEIRRGGIAANIAFGLGQLGVRAALVGGVGTDFAADYQPWLEQHGVDCRFVQVSATKATARFVCTTDDDHNQIASFYAGAMPEARSADLTAIAAALGGLDLVLIAPHDPTAMLEHTAVCREQGYPFAADPSQQLARLHRDEVRSLVTGAQYLFTNEYEAALIEQKTGWSADDILTRVDTRVTTLGPEGVLVERAGQPSLRVAAVPVETRVEPTGVGDAFRSGYLAATSWGLSVERACQLGGLVAAHVLETTGTQEYQLDRERCVARLRDAFGPESAEEIGAHLR
ncbi:adenosine kinase [Motilibacter rhizosphaerae]|uniref:Adenosine kinase n=1 Tax=Motilibacter rhizosphaerae TaxID=598652 RepID=A0A4Q7NR97_9ACTN|nr:carbohydrate kinase family protein [Motilibacter rhizosphaerae]RZS89561.1 adenosine kinase [Motilibacter rhizosphaerae]